MKKEIVSIIFNKTIEAKRKKEYNNKRIMRLSGNDSDG